MYEKTKKRIFNMDSFFDPGSGELYMGFEKQGCQSNDSILGKLALIAMLGMGWPIFLRRYMVLQFFSMCIT